MFVDFGWDSLKELYKPQDLIDDDKRSKAFQGKTIEEILFGEKGYVTDAHGDLETNIGMVVNFDSNVKENGSVECSLEIVSKNAALLQSDVDDKVKFKLLYALDFEIMKYAEKYFKMKKTEKLFGRMLDLNTNLTAETMEENNEKARLFAAANLSNANGNMPTEKSIISGVYWQTILNDKGESTPGSTKNIYISFGLFEDSILNSEFGIGKNLTDILSSGKEFGNFEARFDSSNTYVKFDENLLLRQKYEKDATKLSYLYPENWENTYNTIIGKVPDNKVDFEDDIKYKKIPLREIFINLKLIKDSFNNGNSVNDCITKILDKINSDSHEIFDLQISSGDVTNTKLSIIDRNFLNDDKENEKDFFDKLFIFKPMSKSSIVKNYNLSISTPKGEYQSMLAIQSLPSGQSLFPLSSIVDKYLSLNVNTQQEKRRDGKGSDVGVVYLPEMGSYQSDKLDEDLALESSLTYHFDNVKIMSEQNTGDKNFLDNMAENFGEAKSFTWDKDEKVEKSDNINEDKIEAISDDVQIASSMSEYFGFLAKSTYVEEIPTLISIANLSLGIYGISSLTPGDLLRVDYLPERQRNLIYFQITKVTHSVNSSTWTTQLETVPRIRTIKKKDSGLWRIKSKIRLTKSFLEDINLPSIDNIKKKISALEMSDFARTLDKVEYSFKFKAKDDFSKTYGTLFGGTEFVADGHKIFKVGTTSGENLPVPYYLQANPNQSDFNCPSINGKIITVQVKSNSQRANDNRYFYQRRSYKPTSFQFDIKLEIDKEYRLITFGNEWMVFPIDVDITEVIKLNDLLLRAEKLQEFLGKGTLENFITPSQIEKYNDDIDTRYGGEFSQ